MGAAGSGTVGSGAADGPGVVTVILIVVGEYSTAVRFLNTVVLVYHY
jgi:hypothetical protein